MRLRKLFEGCRAEVSGVLFFRQILDTPAGGFGKCDKAARSKFAFAGTALA